MAEPGIRTAEGKFTKGTSGNPSGRSAIAREIREYMATFTRECVDKIREIANNTEVETKDRLAAYRWLAEHVLGKATQPISGPDGGPIETTRADFSRLSLQELEHLEAIDRKLSGE